MAKPIFPAPTAGFEVPLEMLSACHRRIQDQCSILCGLVPYLVAHGADAQARAAAAGAVRYFATAATHHHADEDEDLFPALLESMAGSDATCLRQMTAALGAEHRELEDLWRRLRPALERVAAGIYGPKGVYPNVDFYSGVVYQALGIPTDVFTPIFAVGRAAGWLAHWNEQLVGNRIFRPEQIFTGTVDADYVPLEKRP